MPRDGDHERTASPAQMTESPKSVATERSESPNPSEETSPSMIHQQRQFVIVPMDQQVKAPSSVTARLHPYTRPLTVNDVDSCVALENAAFKNPAERASREKVREDKRHSSSPFHSKKAGLGT